MAILWKWCLLFVIVAVVSKNAGADLTETKCEIDVGAKASGFLKFEVSYNAEKLGSVKFRLEDKTFTLYLDGIDNYVYYSSYFGGIFKCKFEAKGLILKDPVVTLLTDSNIVAARGKSVSVAFGDVKVKVIHDNRDYIPLKLKVLRGDRRDERATLKLRDGYSPLITLERESENWLVVHKSQVQPQETEFDVDLTLTANDQVLLTNSEKDEPEIAYKERSVLVCLQKPCQFTFGHQKGVSLLIDPVTALETEKVSLEIEGKEVLKLEVVDQRQTVAKFYEEDIATVLKGTLTSKLTDRNKPSKVAFISTQIDDNITFTKDHATFIGKETRGFYKVADGEADKILVFHVVPDKTSAVTDLTFEINNAEASSLEVLHKTVRVEKTPQDLYLLRSQVLETGKQPFSIQAQGNTKSYVTITKSTNDFVNILPGSSGRLTSTHLGLVEKESDGDIPLIFELDSSSQKEEIFLKVGKEELRVKKSPVFKNLTAADFGETKEVVLEVLAEGAEILFKRIDDKKIPLPEVKPCDPDPCKNGGKCKAGKGDEFTCECPKGFKGTTCREKEAEVKPCDPDPCKNGGKCKAGKGDEFTCECAKGFEGTTCGEKKAGNSSTNVKGSFFILFTAFLAFIMN